MAPNGFPFAGDQRVGLSIEFLEPSFMSLTQPFTDDQSALVGRKTGEDQKAQNQRTSFLFLDSFEGESRAENFIEPGKSSSIETNQCAVQAFHSHHRQRVISARERRL